MAAEVAGPPAQLLSTDGVPSPAGQHRDQGAYKTTAVPHLCGGVRRDPGGLVLVRPARTASGTTTSGRQGLVVHHLLTIGYMIARGLAKSGSREPYDDDRR